MGFICYGFNLGFEFSSQFSNSFVWNDHCKEKVYLNQFLHQTPSVHTSQNRSQKILFEPAFPPEALNALLILSPIPSICRQNGCNKISTNFGPLSRRSLHFDEDFSGRYDANECYKFSN